MRFYGSRVIGTCALFAMSCGGGSRQQDVVVVTDAVGRSVRAALPAKRIVSLAPNVTEIVFAAGGSEYLVGVTTADDYPPEIEGLARVSALPVDLEAIVALNPDLVFASDQVNAPRDAERLTELGIPTYFLASGSVAEVFDSIERVGGLLGTEERATTHAGLLRETVEALANTTSQLEQHPDVLLLISEASLHAFGSGSYVHDMIRVAGGNSITADLDTPNPILNEEFVLIADPDVIIGTFGEDYNPSSLIEQHPAWRGLSAVKNNRVYSVNPDIILRPGPRLVDGIFRLAALIDPTVLTAGDMDLPVVEVQ